MTEIRNGLTIYWVKGNCGNIRVQRSAQMSRLRFETKLVTPKMAQDSLGYMHPHQRKLDASRVEQIARAIRAGKYENDGTPIQALASSGKFINGQTRFHGIIKADRPVELTFCYGCPDSALLTVDSGKAKSAAQIEGMTGGSASPIGPATIAQIYLWHKMKVLGGSVKAGLLPMEIHEARATMDQDHLAKSIDAATKARRIYGRTSILASLGYLTGRANAGAFEEFCSGLANGAKMNIGDPPYTLREYLIRKKEKDVKISYRHLGFVAVKAFSAYIAGEKLTKLSYNDDVDFPKIPNSRGAKFSFDP